MPRRLDLSSSAQAEKPRWPCVLPSIAVAVAPVRNLTGDPAQNYLVEAFTDDLVTDLLRHGRGLSLKPLGDDRGTVGNGARTGERAFDYVVTGSAQTSTSGLLRVNMRITDATTSEFLAGMNSSPKTWPRSKRGSRGEFLESFTFCCFKPPAVAPCFSRG